ncbi:MAG: Hpt domain-containing protein, partial [Chloroflexota bacterium]
MEYDAEIMLAFLEEIAEYLPQFRTHLTKLEVKAKDRESLEECYRLAHTIKGTSAMMGLAEISEQGLVMEQALLPVVEKKMPYTPDTGVLMRNRVNRVAQLLAEVRHNYENRLTIEPALPSSPPKKPEVTSRAYEAGFDLDFSFDEDLASLPGFSNNDTPTPIHFPPPPPQPSPALKPFTMPDLDAELTLGFDPALFTSRPAERPAEESAPQSEPEPFLTLESYTVVVPESDFTTEPLPERTVWSNPTPSPTTFPPLPVSFFGPLDHFELEPELERELRAEQTPPPLTKRENHDYLLEADSSHVSFDSFEPQLEDSNHPAPNAELTNTGLPDWIDLSDTIVPPPLTKELPETFFELPSAGRADLLLPDEFPGFESEALTNNIPIGDIDLLNSYGIVAPPPAPRPYFDNGLSSPHFRGEQAITPALEGEQPDDFTDVADLLAQFDHDPGLLLPLESGLSVLPPVDLLDVPPVDLLDAATPVEIDLPPPVFNLTEPEFPPFKPLAEFNPLPEALFPNLEPINFERPADRPAEMIASAEDLPNPPGFDFSLFKVADLPEERSEIEPALQAADPGLTPAALPNLLEVQDFSALEEEETARYIGLLESEQGEVDPDFEMGVLWLAEAHADLDLLKELVANFDESIEDGDSEAHKIQDIASRLRKGATMMDLEAIARQLGVIETAAETVLEGGLKSYMSAGDIFSYELASLMVRLIPYEEGARAYLENVEIEQIAAVVAPVPSVSPTDKGIGDQVSGIGGVSSDTRHPSPVTPSDTRHPSPVTLSDEEGATELSSEPSLAAAQSGDITPQMVLLAAAQSGDVAQSREKVAPP